MYLVLIVAVLLRLVALNQSLWLDEATTAQTVKHFGYLDLIAHFAPTDFHPPLYYLFMKTWTAVFGYSEIALRLPSVLFSLIAGWFVYLVGNKIINKNSGIWAAAFFLFNPLIVYYSQEGRMYLMATCFLTIAVYLFIRLLHRIDIKEIVLLNIFLALSLFTFYGSIFLIASIVLYLIFMSWRGVRNEKRSNDESLKLLLYILPGVVVTLLFLSPLLYTQYVHSKEMLNLVPNWSMVLGKANIKNLLLIPLKFSIGRIQFEPKIVYYLTTGLWTIVVFLCIGLGTSKNKLIGFLFFTPLILGFIVSFSTPLLQYFRFVYLISLYAILIAVRVKGKYIRTIFLAGFIILSLVYVLLPQFHRENWRALVRTIKPNQTIFMVYSSSDPVRYYLDQNHNSSKIKDLSELSSALKQKNILVIPYTADIHGVTYQDLLTKNGYKEFLTVNARGLRSEVWQKR